MVYLINMSKRNFNAGKNKYLPRIKEWVDAHGGGLIIPLSIEFEKELFAMESSGDDVGKAALLAEVSQCVASPLKSKRIKNYLNITIVKTFEYH